MFDRPRSSDLSRRALAAVLAAVAITHSPRATSAVDVPPRVTLWLAENDRGAQPIHVAMGGQHEQPTVYRLPAVNTAPGPAEAGLVIENQFFSGSEAPPAAEAQQSRESISWESVPVVATPPATSNPIARGPRHDVEIVDRLPTAEAPLPPSFASARRAAEKSHPSVNRQEPAREDSDWASDDRAPWQFEGAAADFAGQAITTPELEVTPIANEADEHSSAAAYVARPALPNTPTVAQVSDQVEPSIRRAYSLAQRGALYAARGELIAVLRRIAQSKDAEHGTNQHARALAEGLRALDEADDFMPAGVQLEADLDVRALARSHRTPALHGVAASVMSHDAVARYHAFAQQRIATAVAGEQAGSMALYGLGKIHSRFSAGGGDDLQSLRKSMTMYQAALAAHSDNHLAANELGVLLAQAGHHVEAVAMFQQAVQISPNSTALRNLAIAQRKLGDVHQATRNEQEAQRIAAWERSVGAVSRQMGVQRVTPAEMARLSSPPSRPAVDVGPAMVQQSRPPVTARPAPSQPPRTASKSWWPWSRGDKEPVESPPPVQRIARPPGMPSHSLPVQPRMDPVKSNTVWR